MDRPPQSFLVRHEFAIRRLHSLSGLVPIGLYLIVHLVTNAGILNGAGTFQKSVYMIHGLGRLLPVVEWVFIFIPIIFHTVVGLAIIAGMVPDTRNYPYLANRRYVWQRWTGLVAMVFIAYHVFHMHGWFHFDAWAEHVSGPYGGAKFRPYNAGSTAGLALQNPWILAFYVVGVLACVYHFANGLWTMGITWGVWTSEAAQRRALWVCGAFGLMLAVVGMGSLYGMWQVGRDDARQQAIEIEDRMYQHRIESGEIQPNEHKRSAPQSTGSSQDGNDQGDKHQ